jgi:phytoene synthase
MAERDDVAECRRIISANSKSFSLASTLLPNHARDDAVAAYAWCRRCDDAVDDAPHDRLDAAMSMLRAEADAIYANVVPNSVVAAAFQNVVRRRTIPREYVDELLDGMATDATGVWAPNLDELRRYCYRVAGVVGLMMCHVLGVRDDRALPHAVHLGMGMQLTNIARDVAEDWNRGRLYLPAEWLRERSAVPEFGSPLDRSAAERFAPIVARLLRWADGHYDSGRQGLRFLDRRSAWAVATAASVYQAIGRTVVRQRFDVLAGRAVVSKGGKIRLAAKAFARLAVHPVSWRGVSPPSDILTFARTPVLAIPPG